MMEQRLTDIEIRMEYQDRTIAELNDVLIAQQSQMDAMAADIAKLRNRLEGGDPGFGPANEKPPHY